MTDHIITISREYGSGGRTVGELVAQKLGIPFYDKKLVDTMAEQSGFSRQFIEEHGEYAPVKNSFLFSIAVSSRADITGQASPADRLYACQANFIREQVSKGPCVIVGRSADYILRNTENVFHVFLHADMAFRVAYMREHYGKDDANLEKWLRERDARRKLHYRHYTGREWGDPHNYQMCLSTSDFGLEKTADLIVSMVKK